MKKTIIHAVDVAFAAAVVVAVTMIGVVGCDGHISDEHEHLQQFIDGFVGGGGGDEWNDNKSSGDSTGNNNNNNGGGGVVNNCGKDGTANSCKTAEIDGQTWMAENLNMEKSSGSWCYINNNDSCVKYGRLYDWNTATTVCPTGWRLPDTSDWNRLVTKTGGYSNAGSKLKSASGWNSYNGVSSTNESGFSALPGGYRYSETYFDGVGSNGNWWAADTASLDQNCSDCAYGRGLAYNHSGVIKVTSSKSVGYSVRCVKTE